MYVKPRELNSGNYIIRQKIFSSSFEKIKKFIR
jgi:hypothetical protein